MPHCNKFWKLPLTHCCGPPFLTLCEPYSWHSASSSIFSSEHPALDQRFHLLLFVHIQKGGLGCVKSTQCEYCHSSYTFLLYPMAICVCLFCLRILDSLPLLAFVTGISKSLLSRGPSPCVIESPHLPRDLGTMILLLLHLCPKPHS